MIFPAHDGSTYQVNNSAQVICVINYMRYFVLYYKIGFVLDIFA